MNSQNLVGAQPSVRFSPLEMIFFELVVTFELEVTLKQISKFSGFVYCCFINASFANNFVPDYSPIEARHAGVKPIA